jgi:hypothetical protein
VSGPARGWARVAPRDEGQLARLIAFRAVHPEVVIEDLRFGEVWQARIAEVNGETVITRHSLRELLDRLGELFGEPPR